MMNNKFKKLYEVFEQFLVEHNIEKNIRIKFFIPN